MTRTLLLGLDGATFDVLDPLARDGVLPGLAGLMARGVRAPLRSTANWLTPPAWTTVMTGRTPGNHRVFDFVRAEERDAGMYFTLTDSRDVAVETIWQAASRQGARTIALNFPVMFPPRPVDGCVVPGFVPWRHLRRFTHPRDLYERIKTQPGFELRDLAMDLDLERRTVQGLDRGDMPAWIEAHLRRERQWSGILAHLMATEDWRLAGINFDGNDKLLHLFWRFVMPDAALEPWESRIRDLCLRYFRELDDHLVRAVRLAGPDARTFIVSDHGFGPSTEVFFVNAWLAERGYLRWAERAPAADDEALTVDRLKHHVAMIDWDRTLAYALTPSSNGVCIRVARHPGAPGIRPEDYPAVRGHLAAQLRAFRDPADGGRVVTRVRTREEAYPGAYTELAPDLLLTLRDGGFVSIRDAPGPLKPRAEVVGTHRPDGVFVALGAGIREGVRLPRLDITDVAPTLLYSMGLPVPADYEGRVAREAFRAPAADDLAPGVPVRAGDGDRDADVFTADEEAEIVRRLTALGYL